MNVLSLFNGMSVCAMALESLGVEVSNYYSSEIDKYANQATKALYPNAIQMGDVTKWREWDIDWSSIDFFAGGSPCQGFSAAGKKGGTKAELNGEIIIVSDRETYIYMKEQGATFLSCSHLFWEYALLLDHVKSCNPSVKFMLENVRMSKANRDMITTALNVEPVFIDANLFSAHDRPRYFWSDIEVSQLPEKSALVLADIVEYGVDEKYELSDKILEGFRRKRERRSHMNSGFDKLNVRRLDQKCSCLTARYHKTSMSDPFVNTDGRDRRLTPRECARLQSIPEHHIETLLNAGEVSNHYQVCHNYPSGKYKGELCKNVKSKNVISQSSVEKLNCATSTILDSPGLELLRQLGSLSIKASHAPRVGVSVSAKLQLGSALSITNDGNEAKKTRESVQFAMSLSETGGVECALVIQHQNQDTETRCRLTLTKKENSNLTGIEALSIIKTQTVDGLIELSLKKLLEERSEKAKRCIMLMVINLITVKGIFTCANHTHLTSLYIDSLSRSQCSLLEMDISCLKMDRINPLSNSALYKMLGNGWNHDVIVHILKGLL